MQPKSVRPIHLWLAQGGSSTFFAVINNSASPAYQIRNTNKKAGRKRTYAKIRFWPLMRWFPLRNRDDRETSYRFAGMALENMLEPRWKKMFNNQGFYDGLLHFQYSDKTALKWLQQVDPSSPLWMSNRAGHSTWDNGFVALEGRQRIS